MKPFLEATTKIAIINKYIMILMFILKIKKFILNADPAFIIIHIPIETIFVHLEHNSFAYTYLFFALIKFNDFLYSLWK